VKTTEEIPKKRNSEPASLDKLWQLVERAVMTEADRGWYDALNRQKENR